VALAVEKSKKAWMSSLKELKLEEVNAELHTAR
jgi:hypothetical protein